MPPRLLRWVFWSLVFSALGYLYLRHGLMPHAKSAWVDLYSPSYTGCQLAYPIHHDRLQPTIMYASPEVPPNISAATRTLAQLEQILSDEGLGESISLPYWAESGMIATSLLRTENLNSRVIEHHARIREYWLCRYAERLGISVDAAQGGARGNREHQRVRKTPSSCTGIASNCAREGSVSHKAMACEVDNTGSCHVPTHSDAHAVFDSGFGNTYGVYNTQDWQALVSYEGEDRLGLYSWHEVYQACCA